MVVIVLFKVFWEMFIREIWNFFIVKICVILFFMVFVLIIVMFVMYEFGFIILIVK